MTREELSKIEFRYLYHISMEHEHCTTYANEEYGFLAFKYAKKKKDGDFGRSYTHYSYDGKVYKSLGKFLEAIKDVEFEG